MHTFSPSTPQEVEVAGLGEFKARLFYTSFYHSRGSGTWKNGT